MANNIFEELLSQVPIAEIAQKFGIDEDTAAAAVKQALPGLVGGMAVNANSDEGQQKLAGALSKHTPADGKISLDAIDEEDGKKIVKHVLGDQEEAVAQQLGAQAGGLDIGKMIPALLPMLAPILMQFLSGRVGGGAAAPAQTGEQGGGLGDILGGLLGGMGGGSAQNQGGGLGDILGGLLGGGASGGGKQGGSITDLLGGLLGGK